MKKFLSYFFSFLLFLEIIILLFIFNTRTFFSKEVVQKEVMKMNFQDLSIHGDVEIQSVLDNFKILFLSYNIEKEEFEKTMNVNTIKEFFANLTGDLSEYIFFGYEKENILESKIQDQINEEIENIIKSSNLTDGEKISLRKESKKEVKELLQILPTKEKIDHSMNLNQRNLLRFLFREDFHALFLVFLFLTIGVLLFFYHKKRMWVGFLCIPTFFASIFWMILSFLLPQAFTLLFSSTNILWIQVLLTYLNVFAKQVRFNSFLLFLIAFLGFLSYYEVKRRKTNESRNRFRS